MNTEDILKQMKRGRDIVYGPRRKEVFLINRLPSQKGKEYLYDVWGARKGWLRDATLAEAVTRFEEAFQQ